MVYWRLGEILVRKKLLDWKELEDALKEQEMTQERVGAILLRKGYITEPLLYLALAEQYKLEFVSLKKVHIHPQAVERIPASIAWKYRLIGVDLYQDLLVLAISIPGRIWPENEIKELAQVQKIRCVLTTPTEMEWALRTYYPSYVPDEEAKRPQTPPDLDGNAP